VIPSVLVLATGNRGKVAELARLVAEWGRIEVRSLLDEPGVALPEESGDTYEQNAALKARAVAAATGLPALADDSGLEVDALDGAPGVHSARYGTSDAGRIARLLAALAGCGTAARTARFRCVVVLAWPDGRLHTAEGRCEGTITEAPSGTSGFGYDPVFRSAELGRTFADATSAEKARVSHRARAMRALGARLGVAAPGAGS
jgi:XTP/dITP diphosphohydrolase